MTKSESALDHKKGSVVIDIHEAKGNARDRIMESAMIILSYWRKHRARHDKDATNV